MTIPLIGYMAHPLAEFEGTTVEQHIARAKRWMNWLIDTFDMPISANWILVAEFWPRTDEHRSKALEYDVLQAVRSDVLFLVGGRVSDGMTVERDAVLHAQSGVVLDLTGFGAEPPTPDMIDAEARGFIEAIKKTLFDAAAVQR